MLSEDGSTRFIEALENLAANANFLEKSKELESIKNKANEMRGLDKIKYIVKASLGVFLFTGGGYFSFEFFDVLKLIIKK